jgi:putative ABC transport system ATP-binding protein
MNMKLESIGNREVFSMNQGIGNIAVEGKHIVKDFRLGATTTKGLKDISLQVMQGEFVSIMGPSGSGKSTLLYILGGLDVSTSGRVLLDGTDISVSGNEKMSRIMLPLLLDGKKMGSCKKQLERILEVTGLTDRRRHTPRELSGGQQRVAIARALIGNPEILFADVN